MWHTEILQPPSPMLMDIEVVAAGMAIVEVGLVAMFIVEVPISILTLLKPEKDGIKFSCN
jgi:hypothetical protein